MNKHYFLFLPAILLTGCSLSPFNRSKSAIQISTPGITSSVYLNDNHVGQTPFVDEKLKPGDYTLRLLVENDPSKDWQTKITLSPEITTVVERTFGPSPNESGHYILQLEPISNPDSAEVSFITNPDNVIVTVDNQPRGFSPLALTDITPGDHALVLSGPGHQTMTINAQIPAGYRLVISAQLARSNDLGVIPDGVQEATSSANEEPKEEVKTDNPDEKKPEPTPTKQTTRTTTSNPDVPFVTILETGTGWLRVRSQPNASGENEVAKVDVGDTFPYIESSDTGWYKIEYEDGEEGWIAARYAKLTE